MAHSLRKQRTVAKAAQVEGFGYWSGRDVRIEFRPASADSGIVFVRGDLQPARAIPALVKHRIETPRRTTLAVGGVEVQMVEHILAALVGLQIDNCEIWTNGAEMPGCDGSSLAFVEALMKAGSVEQAAWRPQRIVTDIARVGDEHAWVEARPARSSTMLVKYRLDYEGHNPIGRQTLELAVTPESFRTQLAPARTFLLQEEAQWLRQRGLGARVTCRDLLVFDDDGPVDNELRFSDECVRHKTLDLIGDLALGGCDFLGHFVAYRSGHRLNAELVRVLLSEGKLVEGRRMSA